LQDMKYRVRAVMEAGSLLECARQDKPMIVLADLTSSREDVCAVIAGLKQDPATRHIPVIAIAPEESPEVQAAARRAGATLVVSDSAILGHLAPLLEQALQVE
jgi:CheY-like chemotaxis protein